jgi:hypothetical protein
VRLSAAWVGDDLLINDVHTAEMLVCFCDQIFMADRKVTGWKEAQTFNSCSLTLKEVDKCSASTPCT